MYYYQKHGKLVPFTGEKWLSDWIKQNHYYRYGSLNKEPYYSEKIPICNLCGSELNIMKKGKTALILSCTNSECITNTKNTKGGDDNLKAFLPDECYEKIKRKRKENKRSYYDIDYLTNIKGLTEQEALEYIEQHKNAVSCKNKGHNIEYFTKKFGDRYIDNLKKRNHLCVEYWTKKGFSEEEAKKKISEKQREYAKKHTKSIAPTKQQMITKVGEENANKFYRERSHLCIEYWLKRGYTEEYGKNKIAEIQRKNNLLVKNHISDKTISFWVNKGYTEEDAKKIISELQRTFTKEKCIEKYGEIEGLKRWEERQNKWQKTLHESQNLHVGFSKISQELFNAIDKQLGKNDYTFYGSKNHEYCIREDSVNYIYDFTDLEHNKIIEFQGDIYHGNPELFTENERPNPYRKDKSCKDLWEFDKKKGEIAVEHGFKILHIWEKDYRENKEQIINKSLKFLIND